MNELKDFSPDRNCWTTCQVYFDDEGEPSLWRRIPDTYRVVPVDILGISEFALRRLQFDTPKNGTDYELITRALNSMLTASKESGQ